MEDALKAILWRASHAVQVQIVIIQLHFLSVVLIHIHATAHAAAAQANPPATTQPARVIRGKPSARRKDALARHAITRKGPTEGFVMAGILTHHAHTNALALVVVAEAEEEAEDVM